MIVDNNKTDNKGKALVGLVGLLCFFVLMAFWPRPNSYSQPDSAAPKPIHQTIDSLAILRQRNDRQDSINLVEARSLTQLTKGLSRRIRKRVDIHATVAKPTVVLRYNGDVFETNSESYANYLIVDVDSFLSEVDTGIYQPVNEFMDEPIVDTVPAPKKNWFQKIFKR